MWEEELLVGKISQRKGCSWESGKASQEGWKRGKRGFQAVSTAYTRAKGKRRGAPQL